MSIDIKVDNLNNSHFDFFSSDRLHTERAQALVEYAVLLALIALVAIAGLTLMVGSVQQGMIEVCAELDNTECQTAEDEPIVSVPPPTTTAAVSTTPPISPTATLALVDPDPTRKPVVVVTEPTATPVEKLITMRVKVVVRRTNNGNTTEMGIRVVIYDNAGTYVAQGVTDEAGKVSFSVPAGMYTVATLYENAWENHGPFNVKNSQEKVIRLKR